LANRFFDYLHAGTPQLTSNFPVYHQLNKTHQVSLLIEEISPVSIANHLNLLLNDDKLWQQIHQNCIEASAEWNWQTESNTLIQFYEQALA
jgi:glycosyltransferase involved in cell wall biosynthesis